jgi:pimeloyl-ACP methyl ester carboxylesterase
MNPMTPPHPSPQRARRKRLFIILITGILLAVFGLPFLAGFITTYALVYAPCDNRTTTPGDFGYIRWEDLTLRARAGGEFKAFYIPGDNGAAIIIPPTTRGGRGTRLHVADLVARHGYGVLIFESRRCAGMGPLSLGYKEVNEVADALAYLQSRTDVDPNRIGVYGFSSAGATSVMAAARLPDLRAVVAEGGYGDFAEGAIGLDQASGTFVEALYKESINISYRLLTGIDIAKLSPLDVIDQIAPRPILLIYGSEERSLDGAQQQLAAAGDNAELWIVPGAGHGDYLDVMPEEYEERVLTFFDRTLLNYTLNKTERDE